ncbi:unnamed protein product [Choristocarpus tenellus]
MLAYSLRKYAGIRSFVMPMDMRDSETWGNTDVHWKMQDQGAGGTTTHSMVLVRDSLWHRLLKRGGEYFLTPQYAWRPAPVVFLVDSMADAVTLGPLFLALETFRASSDHRPARLVLTGRDEDVGCPEVARALGVHSVRGDDMTNAAVMATAADLCDANLLGGAWNLMVGRHFRIGDQGGGDCEGRKVVGSQTEVLNTPELVGELVAGLVGVVETLRPLAVVTVKKAVSHDVVGKALAASSLYHHKVPHIQLPPAGGAGAAAWLRSLAPESFVFWHTPRVMILVVHDERSVGERLQGRGELGTGGHSVVQLSALLKSLELAEYLGDEVGLTVVTMDAVGEGTKVAEDFQWEHGPKKVHKPLRAQAYGEGGRRDTVAVALGSWVPPDTNSFVLVLQSDRVVSRLFYSWLKLALLGSLYRYGNQGRSTAGQKEATVLGGVEGERGQRRGSTGDTTVSTGGKEIKFDNSRAEAMGVGAEVTTVGGGGGVCLPSEDGQVSKAWLFFPNHWKILQTACLAESADEGAWQTQRRQACSLQELHREPAQPVCPQSLSTLEYGGALVTMTDLDGGLLDREGGLMSDDLSLIELAEHFFISHERETGTKGEVPTGTMGRDQQRNKGRVRGKKAK